ncbi:putative reverse transcriptase domain-containing protein [Tanacetum coccineum]
MSGPVLRLMLNIKRHLVYPTTRNSWFGNGSEITLVFILTFRGTPQVGMTLIGGIVDRLTKSTHFLPVKTTDSMEKLTLANCMDLVCRHWSAYLDHIGQGYNKFASRFWQSLQGAFGTQLDMSTAYHPQTDGQSERTIQMLEDMLRACVIDFGGYAQGIALEGRDSFWEAWEVEPTIYWAIQSLRKSWSCRYKLELPRELQRNSQSLPCLEFLKKLFCQMKKAWFIA